MRKLSIGVKIGGGFLSVGLILLISGATSYWVINTLNQALSNITGPVMDSMVAAESGIQNVQKQLLAVDSLLIRSRNVDITDKVRELDGLVSSSLEKLTSSGRSESQALENLAQQTENFVAAREVLTESHKTFLKYEEALTRNANYFGRLLVDVERLASDKMMIQDLNTASEYDLEKAANEIGDEAVLEEPLPIEQESDLLAIVSAAGEAKLAILSRLNLYRQFKDNTGDPELKTQSDISLEDLGYAIETIIESDLFQQKVRQGAAAGQSYTQALQKLLNQHKLLLQSSMDSFLAMNEAHIRYAAVADNLMRQGESVHNNIRRDINIEREALDSLVETGFNAILFALVLGILLAFPIYWLTVRSIEKPVTEIRRQLYQLSQGDGDLTVKVEVKSNDEIADVANAFNAFSTKLRTMIITLHSSVDRLVHTSHDIAQVADRTGEEVRRQQQEIGSVATAVNELTASFQEVVNSTSRAEDQAKAANNETINSREIVGATVARIEEVVDKVEEATLVVSRLGEKSDAISVVFWMSLRISQNRPIYLR